MNSWNRMLRISRCQLRRHAINGLVVENFNLIKMCDYAEFCVDESCGYVDEDFPRCIAALIKLLLCYKKTQFAIFLDKENNNGVRVASRKQYLRIKTCLKANNMSVPKIYSDDNIIKSFSQPASLVRLVKEAIKYNPFAKHLRYFTDKQLVDLCKIIMEEVGAGYKIKDVTVQECYNAELSKSNIGSGARFATTSCMYGVTVGKFYDLFNVKGKMIVDSNDKFIGRYLEWKMDNGKTFVDRLYVNGENILPALACMDMYYKDRTDVEFYPNKPSGKVKMKVGLDYKQFQTFMVYPYIDSFYNLCHKDNNVFLSNNIPTDVDETREIRHTHNQSDNLFPYKCNKCGASFMTTQALKFHSMFETKFKSGKLFEQNKKLKDIVNKFLSEVR